MKIRKKHIFVILVAGTIINVGISIGALAVVTDKATGSVIEEEALDTRKTIRFATYNVSMADHEFGTGNSNRLIELLSDKNNISANIKKIVEVIQIIRPDVLFLNEFNYDENNEAIQKFQDILRTQTYNGSEPIDYQYFFNTESNVGVYPDPKVDMDANGVNDEFNDAYGFGRFPGQYAMALLSRYPIVEGEVRTFQKFLWKDMPNNKMPVNEIDGSKTYYTDEAREVFRLSSKSHWDVPIKFNGKKIHALVSHPTPPVFDGQVDQNGRRNHDEIRFWTDYIDPTKTSYAYDDTQADLVANQRIKKNLAEDAMFVIMGDQNADPFDGDSTDNPAMLFMNSPYINTTVTPTRTGKIDASNEGNTDQNGKSMYDTASFNGNLRVDYVLPSINMEIVSAKVFWPNSTDRFADLEDPSDHHSVYVTLKV